jgi:hypothetical protein
LKVGAGAPLKVDAGGAAETVDLGPALNDGAGTAGAPHPLEVAAVGEVGFLKGPFCIFCKVKVRRKGKRRKEKKSQRMCQ